MKTSRFHTRRGYEDLYLRLMKEGGKSPVIVGTLSDYQLLQLINYQLISFGCTPMNETELEMDLN